MSGVLRRSDCGYKSTLNVTASLIPYRVWGPNPEPKPLHTGILPANNRVPWRGSSGLSDYSAGGTSGTNLVLIPGILGSLFLPNIPPAPRTSLSLKGLQLSSLLTHSSMNSAAIRMFAKGVAGQICQLRRSAHQLGPRLKPAPLQRDLSLFSQFLGGAWCCGSECQLCVVLRCAVLATPRNPAFRLCCDRSGATTISETPS